MAAKIENLKSSLHEIHHKTCLSGVIPAGILDRMNEVSGFPCAVELADRAGSVAEDSALLPPLDGLLVRR